MIDDDKNYRATKMIGDDEPNGSVGCPRPVGDDEPNGSVRCPRPVGDKLNCFVFCLRCSIFLFCFFFIYFSYMMLFLLFLHLVGDFNHEASKEV